MYNVTDLDTPSIRFALVVVTAQNVRSAGASCSCAGNGHLPENVTNYLLLIEN